jgi:hypothetical protein
VRPTRIEQFLDPWAMFRVWQTIVAVGWMASSIASTAPYCDSIAEYSPRNLIDFDSAKPQNGHVFALRLAPSNCRSLSLLGICIPFNCLSHERVPNVGTVVVGMEACIVSCRMRFSTVHWTRSHPTPR